MDQYGPIWTNVDQCGPMWTNVDPDGPMDTDTNNSFVEAWKILEAALWSVSGDSVPVDPPLVLAHLPGKH